MAPHSMVGHFTSYKILYFCSNFMKNYTFGFYIYNRKYNHCGLSQMWVIWWLLFSFSGGASCKEPSCRCRRHKRRGSDPWVRKIPGEGNGTPLQESRLENPMDREAWRLQSVESQRVGHD